MTSKGKPSKTQSAHFLGMRIRVLRKKHGLTLSQLAAQSDLTAGFLSQLERNLCFPSVPALFAIARSLGVTPQYFFASEGQSAAGQSQDSDCIIRKNQRLRIHYEDGITDELLSPQPCRQLEMLHCRFPPGIYTHKSYSHEGEEAGLVLSGRFELWIAERHFLLEEGDSFCFSSKEPHRYGNPGKTDTLVLWVNSPLAT